MQLARLLQRLLVANPSYTRGTALRQIEPQRFPRAHRRRGGESTLISTGTDVERTFASPYRSLIALARTFGLSLLAGRLEHSGCWPENSAANCRSGMRPIGTYRIVSIQCEAHAHRHNLHAVRSLGERINNQLLILIPPSPHVAVRTNHRFDVFDYVLLLSGFFMKGDS